MSFCWARSMKFSPRGGWGPATPGGAWSTPSRTSAGIRGSPMSSSTRVAESPPTSKRRCETTTQSPSGSLKAFTKVGWRRRATPGPGSTEIIPGSFCPSRISWRPTRRPRSTSARSWSTRLAFSRATAPTPSKFLALASSRSVAGAACPSGSPTTASPGSR